MKSKKLDYFMIFEEYKDRVDKLDLETILDDFINKKMGKLQKIFRKSKVANNENILTIATQMKKICSFENSVRRCKFAK
jgi:hypothetical protein